MSVDSLCECGQPYSAHPAPLRLCPNKGPSHSVFTFCAVHAPPASLATPPTAIVNSAEARDCRCGHRHWFRLDDAQPDKCTNPDCGCTVFRPASLRAATPPDPILDADKLFLSTPLERAAQEWKPSTGEAEAQEADPLTDEEREQYTWWMWRNPNTAKEAGTQRLFFHIAVIEQALTLARQRADAREQAYESMVREYSAKFDRQATAYLASHDRAVAAWRTLRDAVNEYDYLRRECPDDAERDAGWQRVMSAMGYDVAALRASDPRGSDHE